MVSMRNKKNYYLSRALTVYNLKNCIRCSIPDNQLLKYFDEVWVKHFLKF